MLGYILFLENIETPSKIAKLYPRGFSIAIESTIEVLVKIKYDESFKNACSPYRTV